MERVPKKREQLELIVKNETLQTDLGTRKDICHISHQTKSQCFDLTNS